MLISYKDPAVRDTAGIPGKAVHAPVAEDALTGPAPVKTPSYNTTGVAAAGPGGPGLP